MLNLGGKELSVKNFIVLGAIILAVMVLVGVFSFFGGYNSKLENTAISKLIEEKEQSDTEYQQKRSDVDKIKTELSSQQDLLNSFNDYKSNKTTLDSEISEKTGQVDLLNSQVTELNNTITSKNDELERLKNVIVQTGEAPVTISAGEFIVGKDIQAGRYSASGSSNLIVYDSTGSIKVNTILGNSIVGSGNYVCTLNAGDSIEAHARTTFTPIK